MTTSLQLAILAGCLVGGGLAIALLPLLPGQPHLKTALNRLNPDRSISTRAIDAAPATGSNLELPDRVGLWAQRHLPPILWVKVPTRELRIIRKPLHRFYGERVLYALAGLLFPPVLVALLGFGGFSLPITLPVIVSLALAAGMSFLPNISVTTDAKERVDEFTRSLGAFIDQVAMEKVGGAGAVGSLERAAAVGDSWVFARLEEVLNRARLAGQPPWDALTELAEEMGLPDLARFADTMRISGEEGAAVLGTLRASARSLRIAILTRDQAAAGSSTEKMNLPRIALGVVFLLILITPPLLNVAGVVT